MAFSQPAFSFVQYDGPKLPKDTSVRRVIRKQAMRDIAIARRARGNYGRNNQRQSPLFFVQEQQYMEPVARALPPIGLNLPADFRILMELMPLTGLHLGIANLTHLIPEPLRTRQLLSTPQPGSRKLLSFLPSRYNQVPLLQHATDAVLAKLRCMVTAEPTADVEGRGNASALFYYNKALEAMQKTLSDETERLKPETLFATELLGVFESLDSGQTTGSWKHHVNGAAQLIQMRGAHRFETGFEKALFVAHLGPTVMDAFLSNTPCFLDSDDWRATMRSAIVHDESLVQEADFVLSLWANLVKGPRLLKNATDVLYARPRPPRHVIEDVIKEVEISRLNLVNWLASAQSRTADSSKYACPEALAVPQPAGEPHQFTPSYMIHVSLRGTYAVCRMIKARVLFALAPDRYAHLEDECQNLAEKVMNLKIDLNKDAVGATAWSKFMAQGLWIAKGTVETKDIWRQPSDGDGDMIDVRKFDAWCDAIERRRPSIPEES